MANITGKFDWQKIEIVPAFPRGEDAEALWDACQEIKSGTMGYDPASKQIYGSTPFLASRMDTEVRPLGLRAANLRDLSRPEIMSMAQGKYYIDSPTLVVVSDQDSYFSNNLLIGKIMQEVSRLHEKLPCLVTGFDSVPCQDGGYKITIAPRDDFRVIYDERLKGYSGEKFSNVDDIGLPLFDRAGTRTWYLKSLGLSRLCLYRSLDLLANSDDLAYSNSGGRVVIVSGEASARKNRKD